MVPAHWLSLCQGCDRAQTCMQHPVSHGVAPHCRGLIITAGCRFALRVVSFLWAELPLFVFQGWYGGVSHSCFLPAQLCDLMHARLKLHEVVLAWMHLGFCVCEHLLCCGFTGLQQRLFARTFAAKSSAVGINVLHDSVNVGASIG